MKCDRCGHSIKANHASCLRCGASVIDSKNSNVMPHRSNELGGISQKKPQSWESTQALTTANIIGIDLGNTYSAVATLGVDGRVVIIRDAHGNKLTPSVVFLEDENHLLVGWEAKRESMAQPDRIAEFFKHKMGTEETLAIGDGEFTPMELSTIVLKKIKQIANDHFAAIQLGTFNETIIDAVITVPANFNHQARQDTINAAKAAGLNLKHIINEPSAAAIFYAQQEKIQGTIAVYDLGRTTFDCSIVTIKGQEVEILSSQGNQRLGGHDFDNKLLELIQKKFQAQTNSNYVLQPCDFSSKDIEELKKSLSNRPKILASISPPQGGRAIVEVTREEFVAAISTLITKSEMLVEEALDEINLSPSAIDHVVLVGGSTRIPAIRNSVQKLFGQEPKTISNVDEAVVLGAAIYAVATSDAVSLNAPQIAAEVHIGIHEATNHFLGLIDLGYSKETIRKGNQVVILIEKNESLPITVSHSLYTIVNNQTYTRIALTQSPAEETDPRWVTRVWEGNIGPYPAGLPSGTEIKITCSYDTNAVLHCYFIDVLTGKEVNIPLDLLSDGPSSTDIDDFLVG